MTVETHGMQFVVDASGVAKGFHDYESAVQGIFKSLDQFEKKVASTMAGVERAVSNRAALAGFKKSLDQFGNINIDTRAVGKLSALSAAMGSFKAPSEVQAANTRKFFASLSNLPDLTRAYSSIKNLAALKGSLESFKAPPLSQAANLVKFAQALEQAAPALRSLGRISGVSGIANELATISIALRELRVPSASQINNLGQFGLALQHLGRVNTGETGNMLHALAGVSNFKAPTAANIRNLVAFAEALHTIKPIPNAPLIAEQMMLIANAATRANMAMGGFRGNLGAFNPAYGRFNEGTRSAKVEMMGLQNAFSTTFQVGSVLRSLLGSLTVAELGRAFFDATQTANQFHAAMLVLGETPMMTDAAWERLRGDANHFGADLNHMADNFSKFALAAQANGASLNESFKIYEGFQTVMTATHMGSEQQQSVGLAIREMMDQGYVATQRLTRQLGLVLPGATRTLMEEWKKAGEKTPFWDALKKKMVDSTWALDVLSNHYKTVFGPAVQKALESPIQQFNILKNNIMQMMVEIGDAGAKKAFSDLLQQISGYMDPGKAHSFAEAIGVAVTGAVHKLSDAIAYLHDHWSQIGPVIGTVIKYMAEWEILMGSFKIGAWVISPLLGMARVLPILQSVGGGMIALGGSIPQAARASANLTGAMRASAVATLNFRNSAYLATAAMAEEGVAAEGLAAKFMALDAVIEAKAVAGIRSFINLLGGPYLVTIGLVLYGMKQLYDAYSDSEAVMEGTTKALGGVDKAISDANAKMYVHTKAMDSANKSGIDFNDTTNSTGKPGGFLDVMTQKIDKATGGLWSMAGAARQAAKDLLNMQIANVQAQLSANQVMSEAENSALARNQWSKREFGNAIETSAHGLYTELASEVGLQASQDKINENVNNLKGALAKLQKQAENLPSQNQVMANMQAAGIHGDIDKKDPRYSGTEDGKDHQKKGKDPYTQLKEVENAVDTMMSMLEAKDPIGKLYTDFVKNIDKEAQTLFTLGGYKQFLANVKNGSKDAVGEVSALVKVLQSGKGLNEKTMAAIKDRYGIEASGIIELTNALLSDLGQASVEAAAKTLDATYRGVVKARHALDAYSPTSKVEDDTQKALVPIAEQLLKNNTDTKDQSAFNDFYKPMLDGTDNAMDSIKRLKAAVIAAQDPNSKFHDNLMAMGDAGQRLSDITLGIAQNLAYERSEAALTEQFGGKLLQQKKEDLLLSGLSSDQAAIMKDLQAAVLTQLKAKQPVNAQEIAALKQQLIVQQALGKQMERNKQFFDDNGVRGFLNGIKDTGAAINDLDKNFLQSLDDQLVSLGETGKFSFNSIFDTIRNGIIKMSADGLVKNFVGMFFGKGELDGGTPSIFGGTIGKMMGGYAPSKTDLLGSSGANPMYVKWAGDFNNMSVSPRTDQFITGAEKNPAVYVGGEATDAASLVDNKLMGTSSATPMWVRDANNPLGTLGGAGAASPSGTIQFPNGHTYTHDADGYIVPSSGGGGSSDTSGFAGAVGSTSQSPAAAASATVANSFKSNMAQMMPMIGMMFAGAFKSPIAQVGAMFATMMLQKLMMSSMGSGGGGGGLGGGLLKIFGAFLGGGGAGGGAGGAMSSDLSSLYSGDGLDGLLGGGGGDMGDLSGLLGGKEGGLTSGGPNGLVNRYRVSPAAFVNAPHYAEGIPNTSGGMPAILHENEAVIPLSRGRKVPVELTNMQSRGSGTTVVNNFNVSTPDADSFRRSQQQVAVDMHVAASRAFSRNSG